MRKGLIFGAVALMALGFLAERIALSQSGTCSDFSCQCTIENTTSSNQIGNCYIIGYCSNTCSDCNSEADAYCDCLDAVACDTGVNSVCGGGHRVFIARQRTVTKWLFARTSNSAAHTAASRAAAQGIA